MVKKWTRLYEGPRNGREYDSLIAVNISLLYCGVPKNIHVWDDSYVAMGIVDLNLPSFGRPLISPALQ